MGGSPRGRTWSHVVPERVLLELVRPMHGPPHPTCSTHHIHLECLHAWPCPTWSHVVPRVSRRGGRGGLGPQDSHGRRSALSGHISW